MVTADTHFWAIELKYSIYHSLLAIVNPLASVRQNLFYAGLCLLPKKWKKQEIKDKKGRQKLVEEKEERRRFPTGTSMPFRGHR